MVTGATGNLGRILTGVLDRYHPGQTMYLYHSNPPKVLSEQWFRTDLLDPESYEPLLCDVKTVIHLAQVPDAFVAESNDILKDQLRMTENLLHSSLALGVEQIIFVSTLSTLIRSLDPNLITDQGNHSPQLHSILAKSKYKEELLLKKAEAEGLEVLLFYSAPYWANTRVGSKMPSELQTESCYFQWTYDPTKLADLIVKAIDKPLWGSRIVLAEENPVQSRSQTSFLANRPSLIRNLKSWTSVFIKSAKLFFNKPRSEEAFYKFRSFVLEDRKSRDLIEELENPVLVNRI